MAFDKKAVIENALVGGIIDIDKLLACNDFQTIKEGLENYPWTAEECLKDFLNAGMVKEAFRFAVDHELRRIASQIAEGHTKIESDINFRSQLSSDIKELGSKANTLFPMNEMALKRLGIMVPSKEAALEHLLAQISLKLDKEALTGNLNREYFERLLAEGQYELLAIKLCVRLEAVLRCDFHYEGTFEEMLSKYSAQYGQIPYTDEWGPINETPQNKMFHKLRRYRNNISHFEDNGAVMTPDELKTAIDMIVKLG